MEESSEGILVQSNLSFPAAEAAEEEGKYDELLAELDAAIPILLIEEELNR